MPARIIGDTSEKLSPLYVLSNLSTRRFYYFFVGFCLGVLEVLLGMKQSTSNKIPKNK